MIWLKFLKSDLLTNSRKDRQTSCLSVWNSYLDLYIHDCLIYPSDFISYSSTCRKYFELSSLVFYRQFSSIQDFTHVLQNTCMHYSLLKVMESHSVVFSKKSLFCYFSFPRVPFKAVWQTMNHWPWTPQLCGIFLNLLPQII